MLLVRKYFLLLIISALGLIANAQKLTPVDSSSKVHFIVKNFGINTGGDLNGLSGIIQFDADHANEATFDVTVKASTVDTDNEMRDDHLKGGEYFDVEKYPVIKIVSEKIKPAKKSGDYLFTGMLTLKGQTKKIEFPFHAVKRDGGYLFTGEFSFNRTDYGVGDKSISLSDKVKVELSVLAK